MNNGILIIKSCPACGSAQSLTTGPVAAGFAQTAQTESYTQPPYAAAECVECGLLYKTATLDATALDRYYAAVDYRKWEIPGLYPTERIAQNIIMSLAAGSRLLDFGCSSGRLLANFTTSYECYGVEINQEAAAQASKRGITILPFDDITAVTTRPFDVIILSDVFEHLSAPLDLLGKLVSALRPGGLLILITGDGDFHACRDNPAMFWYFRNVEHLIMLTHKHAKFLETALPVKLCRWTNSSHYDFGILERAKKQLQRFAFLATQRGPGWSRRFFSCLPGIGRAKHWTEPPAFNCEDDHVVAVFEKSGLVLSCPGQVSI